MGSISPRTLSTREFMLTVSSRFLSSNAGVLDFSWYNFRQTNLKFVQINNIFMMLKEDSVAITIRFFFLEISIMLHLYLKFL